MEHDNPKDETGEACNICYNIAQEGDIIILECGHSACKNCMKKWLKKDTSCPCCRRSSSKIFTLRLLGLPSFPSLPPDYSTPCESLIPRESLIYENTNSSDSGFHMYWRDCDNKLNSSDSGFHMYSYSRDYDCDNNLSSLHTSKDIKDFIFEEKLKLLKTCMDILNGNSEGQNNYIQDAIEKYGNTM